MRFVVLLFSVFVAVSALACTRPVVGPPVDFPEPEKSTALGKGDLLSIVVVGEKEMPQEYRVQPDGTISFPYLGPVMVFGKEPQEIEKIIKGGLIANKILIDPQVTVVVKLYGSKKVLVLGAVRKPGTLVWTEGMTLVDAISQAGWFESLGESDRVRLTRIRTDGHRISIDINVEKIASGKAEDRLLQPGDKILVGQRVF